ncbi:MAG: TonB-dependent receptor [Verrucomicrobia bacterium]|nr:TonB-dependent receptor [Verrucomicrobiota bacterium]
MPATIWSQAAGTGIITGRVSNAATNVNLEGAIVRLADTEFSAKTERDGTYRLPVPAGNYTLAASYTGLDAQNVPVSVLAGDTARRDIGLTAEIYKLSAFTVSGEREGNALAITLQRQAPNVKNIVSADAFGALAGNPADLVTRLAGVVGDSDFGDFRYLHIRGMSRDLSTITMDGNRMADAASAGATREFQFQQVGSDAIERIELTKSPTPDMDADSIGGAVNLVTKSAFDRAPGRRLSYSLGAIWRPLNERDWIHPNYSVSYSEVFGEKQNMGVSLNYGKRQHAAFHDQTSQNHEVTDRDPAFTNSFAMTDSRNLRTRWGGNLRFDYKLSDRARFFANVAMNKHFEHSNHQTTTWATNTTVATRDASGNLTGTGGIIPGYTRDVTEWRAVAASNVNVNASSHNKDGASWHYQLGGVHKFEGLNIDYDVYASDSETVYPNYGGLAITARSVGMRIERRGEPFFPRISQISGPDMLNINSYTENRFDISNMTGRDQYLGAALNLKKDFRTVVPTYLKTGLRIREQTRDLTRAPQRWTLVGADRVMGINPATGINDDNLAQFLNTKYHYRVDGKYPVMPYMARAFRDKANSTKDYWGYNPATSLAQSPQLWQEDITFNVSNLLLGYRNFKETISAGYIMGNVDLGRVSIQGGFRVEKTETSGEGARNEITPAEVARRAAWVGPVTDAELRRRVTAQYSQRITNRGDYRDIYPGLHFKYEPIKGMVMRASWATNIGRPSIDNLLPRQDVTHETERVTINNPGLKPQYADNFDLGVEYYFEPVGLLSAGVFLKEIREFIFTDSSHFIPAGADNGFGGDYAGYNLITQSNGGSARIRGFEAAYQQQFTFLPGWWKGFGVYANYTFLETEGQYNGITYSQKGQVAGFIPGAANLGISYIRSPLTLRVQFNHRKENLNSFNANPALRQYRTDRSVIDIKTVYSLSRRFDLYLDVNNVINEAERTTVRGEARRPLNIQHFSPQFYFGINGRL